MIAVSGVRMLCDSEAKYFVWRAAVLATSNIVVVDLVGPLAGDPFRYRGGLGVL